MIEVYFDGACTPNPNGIVSYGAVIIQDKKLLYTISQKANISSDKTSNNVAEYCGCIAALKYLLSRNLEKEKVIFYGDSKLVIEQMTGKWQVGDGLYVEYAIRARFDAHLFKDISFVWIPREQNTEADLLSRKAYGI